MAVEFHHFLRAGGLVQAVDVLGDKQTEPAVAFHLRQGNVRCVRLSGTNLVNQRLEPSIEACGVLVKSPNRSHSHGIDRVPHAGRWATKIWNA